MRLKKFFSLFIILGIIGIPSTLANNNAKNIALDYISEFENFGPFWNSRNPSITAETPFFTYDDKNPSYIEYKVSCNDDINCGFVLVNIDGSDVSVPMASTSGKTLSEQLGDNGSSKNFYFDVFNQFSISNSGKISSISPENNSIDNGDNIYSRSIDKNPLYEKFLDLQKNANDNKDDNIKRQEFSKYSTRSITPAITKDSGLAHNEFFSKTMCKSITPCYYQFEIINNGKTVPTGCSPTALSIIIGFYDKYLYTDLIPGGISGRGNSNIEKLQIELGKLMKTEYKEKGSGTTSKNIVDGFDFFKNKGLKVKGGLKYFTTNTTNNIKIVKSEIDNGRPMIANYYYNTGKLNEDGTKELSGHTIVIHGYSGNKILINLGWGHDSANTIVELNGNTFQYNGTKKNLGEYYNIILNK